MSTAKGREMGAVGRGANHVARNALAVVDASTDAEKAGRKKLNQCSGRPDSRLLRGRAMRRLFPSVIPAKAGIQGFPGLRSRLDTRRPPG